MTNHITTARFSDVGRGKYHQFAGAYMGSSAPVKCIHCSMPEQYTYHGKEPEIKPHDYVEGERSLSQRWIDVPCLTCGNLYTHDIHSKTQSETITEEASRIVYGDREKAYDAPSRNFRKLAHMWTGTILEKLKPGQTITARDVALMLVQLKVSRESFQPNRENRVDGIGYWLCEDRVVAEDNEHASE